MLRSILGILAATLSLSAGAVTLTVTPTGSGSFSLDWDDPTGPYLVEQDGVLIHRGTPPVAVDALAAGTYEFAIRQCVMIHGTVIIPICQQDSASASGTDGALGAPGSLTASAAPSTGDVTLTWTTVAGVDRYRLERSRWNGSSWDAFGAVADVELDYPSTTRSHVDSLDAVGVGPGTYRYRIASLGDGEQSNYRYSNDTNASIACWGQAPAAPVGLASSEAASDGLFSMSWAESSCATGYRLERRIAGGSWQQVYAGAATFAPQELSQNGTWEYQVIATRSGASESAASAVASVSVQVPASNPNPAPSPLLAAIPAVDAHSESLGGTPGSFRVDESGNATYSIPLAVAGGIGGFSPQMALGYSSGGGNGIAGVGWSLSGGSAISRCRRTIEQDGTQGSINFDGNDRFCLDGARLMVVSGTYGAAGSEYRTELDSFVRVTAYGGATGDPSYFVVERKDGTTWRYGDSLDSRAETTAGKAFSWAVSEIEDASGNTIDFSYTTAAQGEHLLDRVDWDAGNSDLRFFYADRTDRASGYIGGFKIRTSKRLTRVESRTNGAELRRYDLAYDYSATGRSRLLSVQECVGTTICRSPTEFTWSAPGTGFNTTAGQGFTDSTALNLIPGDIDGDGRMEFVFRVVDLSSGSVQLRQALSDGTAVDRLLNGWDPAPDPNASGTARFIDYNADGRQDLVFRKSNGDWAVFIAKPDSTGRYVFKDETPLSLGVSFASHAELMDINGDARPDFVYATATGHKVRYGQVSGGFTAERAITLPSPGPNNCIELEVDDFRVLSGDLNGDGMADGIVQWACTEDNDPPYAMWRAVVRVPPANGLDLTAPAVFAAYDTLPNDIGNWQVADVNGDGLSDLIHLPVTGFGAIRVELSTGTQLVYANGGFHSFASNDDRALLADVDEDGDVDIVVPETETSFKVLKWNDDAYATTPVSLTGITPGDIDEGERLFIDVDGDGRTDYVKVERTGEIRTHRRFGSGTAQDRITGIDVRVTADAAGRAKTEIDYGSITDPSQTGLYTRGAGGVLGVTWGRGSPVFDMYSPQFVVSEARSSSPRPGDANAMAAVSYAYGKLRLQSGGRGPLGFETLTTTDEQTGNRTVTTYSQQFPTVGMPVLSETFTATDVKIAESTSTYPAPPAPGAYPADGVHNIYATQSVEQGFDLVSAGLVTTVTTDQVQDSYGNVTSLTVTTAGGGETFVVDTANTYADSISDWHLGRLTQAVVTHTRGSNSVVRTATFEYDTLTGLLTKETTEPSGAADQRLETTHVYDSVGNEIRTEVSGWDGVAQVTRQSQRTYDLAGRYLVDERNALGEVTASVITRDALGRPTKASNIDDVEADTAYDAFGSAYFVRDETGGATTTTRRACAQAIHTCAPTAVIEIETLAAGGGRSFVQQDVVGREVRTISVGFGGQLVHVDKEYDAAGRLQRQSQPYFANGTRYWSSFSYDVLGRAISTTVPREGTATATSTQSYSGLTTTITNARSNARTERRNALGELVEVTDAGTGRAEYSYDAQGNLTRAEQFDGQTSRSVSTISYDLLGRKTSMSDADMGTWSYAYNAFGELIRQTDAVGNVTTVSFDALGRMVRRRDYLPTDLASGVPLNESTWVYGLGKLLTEDLYTRGASGLESSPEIARVFVHDVYGRSIEARTTIGQDLYLARTTYDEYGRVFQQFDASGSDRGAEMIYDAFGHMTRVDEARFSGNGSAVLYDIVEVDAFGNVSESIKGGAREHRDHDPASGRMTSADVVLADSTNVYALDMTWDEVGNLLSRSLNGASETFDYDVLDRMYRSDNGTQVVNLTYDATGNIQSKSDVGTYTYGAGSAGPHAVTAAGSATYGYDLNGNMVSGNGRSVSYTPFNKPGHITRGSASVTIAYGPNRTRYERLDADATDTTRTRYLGSVEEIVEHLGGSEVHKLKRYLPGGVVMTEIGLTTEQRYLFGDHLGSTNLVLDQAGQVVQRMAFDAFGRRAAAGDNPTPVLWTSLAESLIWGFDTDETTKGFTGHEHLDGVGLIHMNGRVYDPVVGRFLSADPFVQAPSNTQSLNRYSYVLNNPLSYTDPSGYIFKSIRNSLGRKAGAIGGLVQLFGALSGQFWLTVAAGTVGNGIAEGSLSGALRGAFNAALGHQLGAAFGKKHTLRTLAGTAVSRGIESELNGGQFVRGFAATVLPPLIAKASSGGGAVRRTLAALVAGGSRSALQGHRFANGAATAAFGLALAGGQDGSPGTGASAGATLAAGAAAADTEAEAGLGALVSAADEAWMRIDQYIAAHPGEHVVVAREDFEAIFEADLRLARSLRLESVPVDRHETYLENASSDTLWFEEEYKDLFFHIEGVGRAHGADINYYGVGMTFAGFGYSEAYLRTGVIGWNAIQWWERDFASREVRQMQTGQFWAMRGYRAYNAGRD